MQNDIASLTDKGSAVGIDLDLSTAFDTMNHSILFDDLEHWYDIDGAVLKWVKS